MHDGDRYGAALGTLKPLAAPIADCLTQKDLNISDEQVRQVNLPR